MCVYLQGRRPRTVCGSSRPAGSCRRRTHRSCRWSPPGRTPCLWDIRPSPPPSHGCSRTAGLPGRYTVAVITTVTVHVTAVQTELRSVPSCVPGVCADSCRSSPRCLRLCTRRTPAWRWSRSSPCTGRTTPASTSAHVHTHKNTQR